ncbi:hypothetical protein [Kitasatospora sp. NPDC093102]|uniref:hypothetical protein n=1 Tax=Kitasatospora sp. NPDC093102 TaxID=3155069 RepID=UPI00343AA7BC
MSRQFPRTAVALAVLASGLPTTWSAPLSVARQSPGTRSARRAALPSGLSARVDFDAAPGTGVTAGPDDGPLVRLDCGAGLRGPFAGPRPRPQPGRGEYRGADPSIAFPAEAEIGRFHRRTAPAAVGDRRIELVVGAARPEIAEPASGVSAVSSIPADPGPSGSASAATAVITAPAAPTGPVVPTPSITATVSPAPAPAPAPAIGFGALPTAVAAVESAPSPVGAVGTAGRPGGAGRRGGLAGVLLVLTGLGLITRRVFARRAGVPRR